MKTRILIIMIMASFLLNGCDFGRGADRYNSTWSYTFGKDKQERQPIRPVQPPAPPEPEFQPEPQRTPQPQPQSQPRVEQQEDRNVVSRTYPCGDCGVIRLDRWMPAEVQLNVPFMYTIRVINLTSGVVDDIVVREQMADNFKVIGSDPQAQASGKALIWNLGSIPANSSQEITVKGLATADDAVLQCATMTYVVPACARASVVRTELLVAKIVVDEALLCETIPMRIGVKNTGSGVAHDVVIYDSLPAGITNISGEADLTFNVGTLYPGQAKEYPVDLKASRTGVFENVAKATCANGIWVESTPARVTVRQPVLDITKTGPADRFMGRPIPYQITVTNRGNANAQNLVVSDTVPAGMSFVSADSRGVLSGNRVVWNLPALAPNQSQVVNVAYNANRLGTFVNQAVAETICADPVSASARTTVRGIAAVLLEVIDVEDPIEVAAYETYLITTTNQGTSDGTNVRIVCTLEDSVQYASSDGPTRATVEGRTITFAPLPRLAPKAKVTWKVVVKAVKPADSRFQITLNSDQLERSVQETESTHIY